MNLPEVTVMVITYDRPGEIRRTIGALAANLLYPPDKLRWHIADDASPNSYLADVLRFLRDEHDIPATATVTKRGGWGANVNKALENINTDYVFQLEDDYVAKRSINLQDGVWLMEAVAEVGLVRYDGVSGHALTLDLRECKRLDNSLLDWLLIRRDSLHLNVYSNRPHLKHRRFHDKYGPYKVWPPGTKGHLGLTESEFAHRVKDGADGPEIAILADGVFSAFDHVGHSRQGSELDIVGGGKDGQG